MVAVVKNSSYVRIPCFPKENGETVIGPRQTAEKTQKSPQACEEDHGIWNGRSLP